MPLLQPEAEPTLRAVYCKVGAEPALVTFGILVVEPPVTTSLNVALVTTVFFVTLVGVLVVQDVISSAAIAVPALADPTEVVLGLYPGILPSVRMW